MECEALENDSKVSNTPEEISTKEEGDKEKVNGVVDLPMLITTEDVAKASEVQDVAADNLEKTLDVKVVYSKKKYDVMVAPEQSILSFKKQLQELIGIPDSMQKLMYKGLLQDSQTISTAGITKGAKIMLVGSTLNDVLAVSSVSKQDVAEMDKASATKEPLCKQKLHKKVLDKGVPEDAMPGSSFMKEPLPPGPLSGMLNKHGGKVRLTFKLESDQVWLSTKERTEKLPMGSIKNVVSESIEGHEGYHILGLQLGTTEASRYWIYWVPAQYVDAIKDAVLGKWQYF